MCKMIVHVVFEQVQYCYPVIGKEKYNIIHLVIANFPTSFTLATFSPNWLLHCICTLHHVQQCTYTCNWILVVCVKHDTCSIIMTIHVQLCNGTFSANMATIFSTHSCTLTPPAFNTRSGFRGGLYALSIPVNPV